MRKLNHLLRIVTVILLCVGHFQSHAHPSVQYLNMNDRNPATLAEPPAMPKGSYQTLRSILGESLLTPRTSFVFAKTTFFWYNCQPKSEIDCMRLTRCVALLGWESRRTYQEVNSNFMVT